jgi:hypothetical protein
MAGIITIEDVLERIIKEDIADETQLDRMDSLNNPFTHYTESGCEFKMKRLARIKSIAAAFKKQAKTIVDQRKSDMKSEGYLRLSTESPIDSLEDGTVSNEKSTAKAHSNSQSIRNFSRSLRKLNSNGITSETKNDSFTTVSSINAPESNSTTPLLQPK